MTTIVSKIPTAKLHECEVIIEEALSNIAAAGEALLMIRDEKLYKSTHSTFEAYCRDRWGMTRVHAGRMIDAFKVIENVTHGLQIEPPQSERQARPLAQLEPEQQAEAWQEAVETAPNGKVTAEHVQTVVDRIRPIPPLRLNEEQKAHVKEAEEDSENLWMLKSTWKKTNQKDRKQFVKWIKHYD